MREYVVLVKFTYSQLVFGIPPSLTSSVSSRENFGFRCPFLDRSSGFYSRMLWVSVCRFTKYAFPLTPPTHAPSSFRLWWCQSYFIHILPFDYPSRLPRPLVLLIPSILFRSSSTSLPPIVAHLPPMQIRRSVYDLPIRCASDAISLTAYRTNTPNTYILPLPPSHSEEQEHGAMSFVPNLGPNCQCACPGGSWNTFPLRRYTYVCLRSTSTSPFLGVVPSLLPFCYALEIDFSRLRFVMIDG